jgi:hypothetical protein
MSGDLHNFFGVITWPTLVRGGQDVILPNGEHTKVNVLSEMMCQILMDFPGIGDFRKLTESEIIWFYDRIRPSLKKATAPAPSPEDA